MFWSLVTTAFLTIYIVRAIYNYLTFWRYIYKIPAPDVIPFYGNIFKDLATPETVFKQNRNYASKHKDLYVLYGPGMAAVQFLNPDDIEQILTGAVQNPKSVMYDILRNWLGSGLITGSGEKWQTRRKILTPAFHFNILQEFVHIFNKETKNLVEELESRCSEPYIDVVQPITQFTLYSIAETSMGVQLNDSSGKSESYKNAVYEMGTIFMQRLTRLWLFVPFLYYFSRTKKQEEKILKILHSTSRGVIEQRKKLFNEGKLAVQPTNSNSSKKRLAMLDLLLKAQGDGANIDDEGLREEVDTFMFAGHDTTSIAISFALMVLTSHRDIQERIFEEIQGVLGSDPDRQPTYNDLQEMKYLERCIKETLRLFPSAPLIARVANESYTTKTGYYIPKGTMLNISIFDLHRRGDIFEDPLKFDPDRFLPERSNGRHPFAYIPFSAGPRNCIGQRYAMLEVKAALCGILRKFVLEPVGAHESTKLTADMMLRPTSEIRVKFVLR